MDDSQRLPEKMQRLIDMLRPDCYDSSDGDRHWASLYVNFDVGPTPVWEVEWTGFNLPGCPNVCKTGVTLDEACQKVIDALEAARG